MTPEEAIEILEKKKEYSERIIDNFLPHSRGEIKDANETIEMCDMAISALKEVQQYREIGTVEECQEAREKQIPKKPVCKPKPYNESVGFNDEWFCPSCGAYIGYFYEGMDEPEQMEYCNECGQHIARDWSDENEDE